MNYFSVVIPVYNRIKTIERCINSVLTQTFLDYEILVIDDGSSDGSLEYIKLLETKIASLRVFTTGGIQHPGAARNIGIEYSKGKYIAFLDSDDMWNSDKLYHCYDLLCTTHCTVIYHDATRVIEYNETGSFKLKQTKSRILSSSDPFDTLMNSGNCIAMSTAVVESSFLHQYKILFHIDDAYYAWEDYYFWISCSIQGAKFSKISSSLATIFEGSQSITSSKRNYDMLVRIILVFSSLNFWNSTNKFLPIWCYELFIIGNYLFPKGFFLFPHPRIFFRYPLRYLRCVIFLLKKHAQSLLRSSDSL